MSTFSGISTALSSLIAQRTALDVAGQNIANANTDGYTRQRADMGAVSTVSVASMFSVSDGIGAGVRVTSISRADDPFLDAKLRSQTSGASYLAARAQAYSTLEAGLGEPTGKGLASQLSTFWNDWHDAANSTNTVAARSNLLNDARQLTDMIKDQYDNVATQWADARTTTSSLVDQVNALGANVADLNKRILDITISGGQANELKDARDSALTQLAGLIGAQAQTREDGEVDVYVGGNALVFGVGARSLTVTGAQDFSQATGYATDGSLLPDGPVSVSLTWADNPGQQVVPTGGTVAGMLTVLAPADPVNGTGGILAEAAKRLDQVATALATTVNAVYSGSLTVPTPPATTGTAVGDFFDLSTPGPAALAISVKPQTAEEIGVADAAIGGYDASVAQKIADLATSVDGADATWSKAVVEIGNRSSAAQSRSTVAEAARASAEQDQLANASVDTDEETTNMIAFQRAYEAAARVLTTLDEMLDTLINKTGVVGR